ncbi:MAG: 50S ribosomal protein L21e [Candidatus Woesearchaeota archaeon]|nr:50S ribosomal protein L21e [Candidatus Woesearchaeota archaeon]
MVTRIGGARRKTRSKYSKQYRQKGKISLRNFLQSFKEGEKVALLAEPAVQKGMYFRRFHGKVGTVLKKLGSCYEILIQDHNKEKKVIVHPVHLRKAQ